MDACEDALSHQVATFLQVNFAKVMWCVGNVKLASSDSFSIILDMVSMYATRSCSWLLNCTKKFKARPTHVLSFHVSVRPHVLANKYLALFNDTCCNEQLRSKKKAGEQFGTRPRISSPVGFLPRNLFAFLLGTRSRRT